MYTVELYQRIRRACHVEGMSVREAARVFGVHRGTVRKMLRFSIPPGYQKQGERVRPKLGPYTGMIERILEEDKTRPVKQRHTALRIYERLKDEHGFTGGYTIVKDYVREQRVRGQEMFVPLVHPPGDAQADFGEALVEIGGVEQKAHFLAVDLPQSDACFVKAYPAETTEAFCDGHNSAFEFFGGVPSRRARRDAHRPEAGPVAHADEVAVHDECRRERDELHPAHDEKRQALAQGVARHPRVPPPSLCAPRT
jgi:transposase